MYNQNDYTAREILADKKEIVTNIENSKYFKDAFGWHFQKYCGQYREFAILFVICVVMLIFFSVALYSIFTNAKNISTQSRVIETISEPDTVSVISAIPRYFNHTDKTITRFYLEKYVKEFEGFKYDKGAVYLFEQKMQLLLPFSTPSVMESLNKRIQAEYLDENISGGIRMPFIVDFEFIEQDNLSYKVNNLLFPSGVPNEALIYVSILKVNTITGVQTRLNREIKLKFYFRHIFRYPNGTFSPVKIIVSEYSYIK